MGFRRTVRPSVVALSPPAGCRLADMASNALKSSDLRMATAETAPPAIRS